MAERITDRRIDTDRTAPLSPVEAEAAVAEADLRVLLMVLYHFTGEDRWLRAPFQPRRDVKLIADEDAGLSAAAQAEIRAAAVALLSAPLPTPAVEDPGDARMVELMSHCLGERVPAEYAPMMREEMGFRPRQVRWSRSEGPPPEVLHDRPPVIVVGAGASGIALGANLEKLGLPYLILEKNQEVGGTWLENRYPGCSVDTPNEAYSFSFGERYPWSRNFSPRDEIEDYLIRSADACGIRPRIRFGTRVTRVDWDEAASAWRVGVAGPDGEEAEILGSALVSAIGQLSLPAIPKLPGAETFRGRLFHSAEWPEDLALSGKRVAVIGTGASAMQIVPSIAGEVAALTVFQRSAQWVRPIPRFHDPISAGAQTLLRKLPFYAAWVRFSMLWRYGDGLLPSLRKDPDWPHPERSLNRSNDRHRQEMTDHILRELGDRQDLVAKCLPDYPPYGKRILLDNGWYRAITRPNVALVTTAIDRLTPDGILDVEGNVHAADVIVLSTGFQVAQMAARLNITGRDGRALAEAWGGENPTAHLGITVPGFPNLFCMQGPNTGLGHGGSAIFQAECQARYIATCLVQMAERGIAAIDVKPEVHDAYVRKVDAEHEQMIWTHPGMSTYYRNPHGRVVSVMPWRLVDYWGMTEQPDLEEYRLTLPPGKAA